MQYSSHKFMKVAKSHLKALELLLKDFGDDSFYSFGLIACLSMETGLKAYLIHAGATESELKKLGHNLQALWDRAFLHGIRIKPECKDALELLSQIKNVTVAFRYPSNQEKLFLPNPQGVVESVRGIIDAVEAELRKTKNGV